MASTWKPDLMIYHSPCDDGFAAAWVARRRWGETMSFRPGVHGAAVNAQEFEGKNVLIADFSLPADQLRDLGSRARSIVVLDHHVTAQQALSGLEVGPMRWDAMPESPWPASTRVRAHFDMNKSGARLAWEFCFPDEPVPELIHFVEDRDLFRFQFQDTRAFSLYLRSFPMTFRAWDDVADALREHGGNVMEEARSIERFYDAKVVEAVREFRIVVIDGHKVPCCNVAWAFASDVCNALLRQHPEAPFAACYYDSGHQGSRVWSLRSDDDRQDVAAIAKRYGGGGHRNAAGFRSPL